MQVICFEEKAFYELLNRVIEYVQKTQMDKGDKWVTPIEAMKILGIKSKTTLQKLRNEGLIRYSQPERRIILYDRESLFDYLNGYAKEPFGIRKKQSRI